jgi:hypothetical protein
VYRIDEVAGFVPGSFLLVFIPLSRRLYSPGVPLIPTELVNLDVVICIRHYLILMVHKFVLVELLSKVLSTGTFVKLRCVPLTKYALLNGVITPSPGL